MPTSPRTTASNAPAPPRLVALSIGAAFAVLAVAVLPFPAAGLWPGGGYPDVAALGSAMTRGLVRSWAAGATDLDPGLAAPVAFWARFHVVKALLAVPLLVVAVLLGRGLWRECVRSTSRGRRAVFAFAGVLEAPLVLLGGLLVVANVQGALVPLSSALGLVDVSSSDATLSRAVHGIEDALGAPVGSATRPALTRLVEDFAAYHAVMVVIGAVVTVGLGAVAVRLWRRSRGPAVSRPGRSVSLGGVVVTVGLAASFALITAANLSTAAHPATALLGFFQGSA